MTSKVKALVLLLMLAVLSTCVLSTSVLSGEHPWDSDRHPDTLIVQPPVVDTVTNIIGTTRSGTGTGSGVVAASAASSEPAFVDVVQQWLFRLVWKFTQRSSQARSYGSDADRW